MSYLASRQPMEELAQIYHLDLGPELAEIPHNGPPWIAELSNGWSIWWVGSPESFTLHTINPHLACAPGESSYAVSIAEFCMRSTIAKYTSSSKRWSVTHNGDDSPEHLKITGKPPQVFAELREKLFDNQRSQTVRTPSGIPVPNELKSIADDLGATIAPFGGGNVDYVFDLPAQLGQHLFGFRHDQEPRPESVLRCVEVLDTTSAANFKNRPIEKDIKSQKASLWRRIIGR